MAGERKVYVRRDVLVRDVEIYVVEHGQELDRLLRPADDGWTWVDVEPQVEMPGPTIQIPVDLAELLMEGIAEEVMGVEDPARRQSRAEGRLAATERHLEDLRQLTGMGDDLRTEKRSLTVDRGSP